MNKLCIKQDKLAQKRHNETKYTKKGKKCVTLATPPKKKQNSGIQRNLLAGVNFSILPPAAKVSHGHIVPETGDVMMN